MRAWYGGKCPPAPEVLSAAEGADANAQLLYDHESRQGEWVAIFRGLYDSMDSLKRNPQEFRTWTSEDGAYMFLQVLLDFALPDLRSRVQALQRLGGFQFRKSETPEERKAKVSAVLTPPQGDSDYRTLVQTQAKRLSAIWAPRPDTLLDFAINRPAQVGRLVSERLSPGSGARLRVVGHPFTEVRRAVLQPLAAAKTVAYERGGEIHLVVPVRPVLEKWDQDASAAGGCKQLTLLDSLLLHEILEVVLDATEPDLEPLDCHIVASTFERYLKGQTLNVAVEDFFLEWPQPSSEELQEQQRAELEEQLREMSQFLDDQQVPEEEDSNLERLPVDPANPGAVRKVKTKKVVASTGDGKTRTVKKGILPKDPKKG